MTRRATNFAKFVAPALPLLAALALPATAADLLDCNTWQANARNLMLPASEHTRSYANNRVHLIGLDTGEPACCSYYIMVLWPAPDEGYLECALITRFEDSGFANLSIADTVSSYDPAFGLRLDVPVYIYLPEESFGNSGIVGLTLNQATSTLTADFTPGPNE